MSSLLIKKNPKRAGKPLTIILGRSVSKKATARNLLKRKIKSIMRPIVKNSRHKFIVIVKPKASELGYSELKKEIYDSII